MSLLGTTSIIAIIAAIVIAFMPVGKAFLALVLCAPMTTIAIVNIGGNSILIYHVIWAIVVVKLLLFEKHKGGSFNKLFVPFLAYSALSIGLSFFNQDVFVFNVNNVYTTVSPSIQQITQWGYLFIAISTAMVAEYMLRNGIVDKGSVETVMDLGLLFVIGVAFLQLLLPAETITTYFRNSVHSGYLAEGGRISSTFQEPSMLSLYLLPMMGIHMVRLLRKPSCITIVYIVAILIICIMNNSSSAFLALIILVPFVIIGQLKLFTTVGIRRSQILLLICFVFVVMGTILSGVLGDNFAHMISKMMGEGVSGVERKLSINVMWQVFLDHPILGIGWGTSKSAAFFCWLAELGIVGFSMVFLPTILIMLNLWARLDEGFEALTYLISALTILFFVSSEAYYLPLWIVVGLAMYQTGVGLPEYLPWKSGEMRKRYHGK